MRIVRENIEFKRGIDSRSSLNIGANRIHYPPFDTITEGVYLIEWISITAKIPGHSLVYIDDELMFHPLTEFDPNIDLDDYENNWRSKLDLDLNIGSPLKDWIDSISMRRMGSLPVNENIDFKRGQDPKKALRLGPKIKDIQEISDKMIEDFPDLQFRSLTGNIETYFKVGTIEFEDTKKVFKGSYRATDAKHGKTYEQIGKEFESWIEDFTPYKAEVYPYWNNGKKRFVISILR